MSAPNTYASFASIASTTASTSSTSPTTAMPSTNPISFTFAEEPVEMTLPQFAPVGRHGRLSRQTYQTYQQQQQQHQQQHQQQQQQQQHQQQHQQQQAHRSQGQEQDQQQHHQYQQQNQQQHQHQHQRHRSKQYPRPQHAQHAADDAYPVSSLTHQRFTVKSKYTNNTHHTNHANHTNGTDVRQNGNEASFVFKARISPTMTDVGGVGGVDVAGGANGRSGAGDASGAGGVGSMDEAAVEAWMAGDSSEEVSGMPGISDMSGAKDVANVVGAVDGLSHSQHPQNQQIPQIPQIPKQSQMPQTPQTIVSSNSDSILHYSIDSTNDDFIHNASNSLLLSHHDNHHHHHPTHLTNLTNHTNLTTHSIDTMAASNTNRSQHGNSFNNFSTNTSNNLSLPTLPTTPRTPGTPRTPRTPGTPQTPKTPGTTTGTSNSRMNESNNSNNSNSSSSSDINAVNTTTASTGIELKMIHQGTNTGNDPSQTEQKDPTAPSNQMNPSAQMAQTAQTAQAAQTAQTAQAAQEAQASSNQSSNLSNKQKALMEAFLSASQQKGANHSDITKDLLWRELVNSIKEDTLRQQGNVDGSNRSYSSRGSLGSRSRGSRGSKGSLSSRGSSYGSYSSRGSSRRGKKSNNDILGLIRIGGGTTVNGETGHTEDGGMECLIRGLNTSLGSTSSGVHVANGSGVSGVNVSTTSATSAANNSSGANTSAGNSNTIDTTHPSVLTTSASTAVFTEAGSFSRLGGTPNTSTIPKTPTASPGGGGVHEQFKQELLRLAEGAAVSSGNVGSNRHHHNRHHLPVVSPLSIDDEAEDIDNHNFNFPTEFLFGTFQEKDNNFFDFGNFSSIEPDASVEAAGAVEAAEGGDATGADRPAANRAFQSAGGFGKVNRSDTMLTSYTKHNVSESAESAESAESSERGSSMDSSGLAAQDEMNPRNKYKFRGNLDSSDYSTESEDIGLNDLNDSGDNKEGKISIALLFAPLSDSGDASNNTHNSDGGGKWPSAGSSGSFNKPPTSSPKSRSRKREGHNGRDGTATGTSLEDQIRHVLEKQHKQHQSEQDHQDNSNDSSSCLDEGRDEVYDLKKDSAQAQDILYELMRSSPAPSSLYSGGKSSKSSIQSGSFSGNDVGSSVGAGSGVGVGVGSGVHPPSSISIGGNNDSTMAKEETPVMNSTNANCGFSSSGLKLLPPSRRDLPRPHRLNRRSVSEPIPVSEEDKKSAASKSIPIQSTMQSSNTSRHGRISPNPNAANSSQTPTTIQKPIPNRPRRSNLFPCTSPLTIGSEESGSINSIPNRTGSGSSSTPLAQDALPTKTFGRKTSSSSNASNGSNTSIGRRYDCPPRSRNDNPENLFQEPSSPIPIESSTVLDLSHELPSLLLFDKSVDRSGASSAIPPLETPPPSPPRFKSVDRSGASSAIPPLETPPPSPPRLTMSSSSGHDNENLDTKSVQRVENEKVPINVETSSEQRAQMTGQHVSQTRHQSDESDPPSSSDAVQHAVNEIAEKAENPTAVEPAAKPFAHSLTQRAGESVHQENLTDASLHAVPNPSQNKFIQARQRLKKVSSPKVLQTMSSVSSSSSYRAIPPSKRDMPSIHRKTVRGLEPQVKSVQGTNKKQSFSPTPGTREAATSPSVDSVVSSKSVVKSVMSSEESTGSSVKENRIAQVSQQPPSPMPKASPRVNPASNSSPVDPAASSPPNQAPSSAARETSSSLKLAPSKRDNLSFLPRRPLSRAASGGNVPSPSLTQGEPTIQYDSTPVVPICPNSKQGKGEEGNNREVHSESTDTSLPNSVLAPPKQVLIKQVEPKKPTEIRRNLDKIRASIVKLKHNGVGGVGKATSTLVRNKETGRYVIRDVDDDMFDDIIKADMTKPNTIQEEEYMPEEARPHKIEVDNILTEDEHEEENAKGHVKEIFQQATGNNDIMMANTEKGHPMDQCNEPSSSSSMKTPPSIRKIRIDKILMEPEGEEEYKNNETESLKVVIGDERDKDEKDGSSTSGQWNQVTSSTMEMTTPSTSNNVSKGSPTHFIMSNGLFDESILSDDAVDDAVRAVMDGMSAASTSTIADDVSASMHETTEQTTGQYGHGSSKKTPSQKEKPLSGQSGPFPSQDVMNPSSPGGTYEDDDLFVIRKPNKRSQGYNQLATEEDNGELFVIRRPADSSAINQWSSFKSPSASQENGSSSNDDFEIQPTDSLDPWDDCNDWDVDNHEELIEKEITPKSKNAFGDYVSPTSVAVPNIMLLEESEEVMAKTSSNIVQASWDPFAM